MTIVDGEICIFQVAKSFLTASVILRECQNLKLSFWRLRKGSGSGVGGWVGG
jgi:hypothetical protein